MDLIQRRDSVAFEMYSSRQARFPGKDSQMKKLSSLALAAVVVGAFGSTSASAMVVAPPAQALIAPDAPPQVEETKWKPGKGNRGRHLVWYRGKHKGWAHSRHRHGR